MPNLDPKPKGRPLKWGGPAQSVTVRLPVTLVDEIDLACAGSGETRSDFLVRWLRTHLMIRP